MSQESLIADNDAEMSILGAVFLSSNVLGIVGEEGIEARDFYRDSHASVYKTMLRMEAEGEAVDSLTVRSRMESDGTLAGIGGPATIDLLSGSVPAVGNIRTYCHIVRDKARWRRRREAAHEQIQAIGNEDEDRHSKALAMADANDPAMMAAPLDPADDFIDWYQNATQGLQTPFKELTEALGGGLVPGDVTVIGGWPGHGKTILADQFILHAHNLEANCNIYFNEMKGAFRTARMIARMTGVPWWKIRDREVSEPDWKKVMLALNQLPAGYDRIEGWPVEWIARDLRRNRYDLAVVDTASRIPYRDIQDIERISGTLADVAREVDTHLILVLQLNLERCKTIKRPMPNGRDLLGGGAWYRDARNVIFVHRDQEVTGETAKPLLDGAVNCDKATHGEPERGFVPVTFNARWMRFDEREESGSGGAGHHAPPASVVASKDFDVGTNEKGEVMSW